MRPDPITMAFLIAAMMFHVSSAFAQVPVADGARLEQEAGVAGCTGQIKTSKHAEIQPSQGVLGSVTTAGTIGSAGQTGAEPVFGNGVVNADGTVGGLDLSALLSVANTVQAVRSKKLADVLAATAAVSLALEQNKALYQGLGGQVGAANGLQAGFDQNSGGQVATAGVWNQAVQVGNTTVDLRTQQLLAIQAVTSAATKVMSYDTDKAALVTPAQTPSNVTVTSTTKATPGAEEVELLQPRPQSPAAPTPDPSE